VEVTAGDRLRKVANRSTLQVTHIGRKSGKAHQVTVWFVVQGDKILLPTSNIDRNWVRNVRKTPQVKLSIGSVEFPGNARFLENHADGEQVRANDPPQVPDRGVPASLSWNCSRGSVWAPSSTALSKYRCPGACPARPPGQPRRPGWIIHKFWLNCPSGPIE
jgi:deazaflavin-dependent oxidoreductase (nitroreductase family)